jgi:hypothetical protein
VQHIDEVLPWRRCGESRSAHYQRLEMSMVDPLGGADGESRSTHNQRLETSTAGPLGVGAEDPGAATINAKKYQRWPRCETVPEIREHPPSMLRNINGGPPLGGGARDLGASTINAMKHQRRALGGDEGESGSAHHQCLETSMAGSWEVLTENSGAPTINVRNVDSGPPGPCGGWGSDPHPRDIRCIVTWQDSEWLLTRLQTPWMSLNGCSFGDACLHVPDCAELGP